MANSTERVRAFRARQRAAIEAVPDAEPRELLGPAVETTLAALELPPRHAALGQLARVIALAIDEAQAPAAALVKLGPVMLKVLTELGATPAARKSAREQLESRQRNQVQQLRLDHLRTRGRGQAGRLGAAL